MKFSLSLPVDQVDPPNEFCSAAAIAEMAQAAERAGFAAVHVTEHPFPTTIGAQMGGHHALDPVVALAFVAAATSTLRLHFSAFILPYRNPFLAAKSLADLDVLSGGRVIAGVAPGYMPGEFAALGVDRRDRGVLFDEALAALKAAWTGEPVYLDSRSAGGRPGPGESSRWVAEGNVMRPVPMQQPHPPLWIGGNSLAAVRRAARCAQGWMPFPAQPEEAGAVGTAPMRSIDDLATRVTRLNDERAAAATADQPFDICMTPFTHQHHPRGKENYDPPVLLDEARALAALGVTWMSIKLRSSSRAELLDYIERFGAEVIGDPS